MKDVANELERGRAHQAVGVNAHRDIEDFLAAVNGFGNHELLVFGPGEARRQVRGGHIVGVCDRRLLQEAPNHSVKGIDRRRFGAALVGDEHGTKTIGSRENDFREIRAAGVSYLRREHIFQLMSQFA